MLSRPIPFVFALLLSLSSPTSALPISDPTDLDADGVPGIAGPGAPGSEVPEVVALQGTGSILVDRSHYEGFNVNGFMWFLISQGWTVAENEVYPITAEILAPYDVVLVPTGNNGIYPFSADEVTAFETYLGAGRGLWLFHESFHNPAGINTLSSVLGVTFNYDAVIDSTDNVGQVFWPTISQLASHVITTGVGSYGYYGGCCLAVVSPGQVVGFGDEDAFSANCPSAPPVLATYELGGRIVFAGDITPLHPSYYPSLLGDEEELLLQNIINWLAGLPTTATESSSWGQVKGLFR